MGLEENSESTTCQVNMLVHNKRGVLAKVSGLTSKRGLGITTLDFKPSSKNGFFHLDLLLTHSNRGQIQGLINDSSRLSEVKKITLMPK